MAMAASRKIFVIIDATQEQHLALERLIITSEINEPNSHVHLFISVDPERSSLAADNENLYRDDAWLKIITDKLDAAGAKYT